MKPVHIIATIIVTIVLLSFFKSRTTNSTPPPPIPTAPVEEDMSSEQWQRRSQIISQEECRNHFKAPKTAEFTDECYVTYSPYDKNYFVVGFVDAQNSFGALLRNRYTTTLEFKGGDWSSSANWNVIDFNLQPL